MPCRSLLPLVFASALVLFAGPALAQSSTAAQEQDILKILAPISGPDPIARVLATEAALKSDDGFVRSLALEKALDSNDGHVREVGLIYLVNVQKQFIVNFEISSSSVSSIDSPDLKKAFLAFNPQTLVFDKLDTKTLNLSGTGRPALGNFVGSLSQAGLMLAVQPFNLNCQLQFRGVAEGALRGALTCGALSFPASTPLP